MAPAAEIQTAHEQNKTVIADIDVQGAAEYEILAPQVSQFSIIPPDYETLAYSSEKSVLPIAFHAECRNVG